MNRDDLAKLEDQYTANAMRRPDPYLTYLYQLAALTTLGLPLCTITDRGSISVGLWSDIQHLEVALLRVRLTVMKAQLAAQMAATTAEALES